MPDMMYRVFESLGGPKSGHFGEYCPDSFEVAEISSLIVANCKFKTCIHAMPKPEPYDHFTILSCNYGDYAGVELTAASPIESFGEISAWEGPVFFGENKWRISVQGRYNTWNLFGPEVGMAIVNGPSPQTVDTLHFEEEIDGAVYSLSCARTRTI